MIDPQIAEHSAASLDRLPAIITYCHQHPIDVKTAKALGLTVPPSILDLADEVIE